MTKCSMAITNAKEMQSLNTVNVRRKNKSILILLVRISWYIANSCCKGKFCNNVLPWFQVYLLWFSFSHWERGFLEWEMIPNSIACVNFLSFSNSLFDFLISGLWPQLVTLIVALSLRWVWISIRVKDYLWLLDGIILSLTLFFFLPNRAHLLTLRKPFQ